MLWIKRVLSFLSLATPTVALLFAAVPARATITVYGPGSDAAPIIFGLAIPPVGGAFDERDWAGCEFLMSGLDPAAQPFLSNDMYLIQGNDTNETQAIGIDLGTHDALSGVPFSFSIEQNLVGGRNSPSRSRTRSPTRSASCAGDRTVSPARSRPADHQRRGALRCIQRAPDRPASKGLSVPGEEGLTVPL